MRSTRIGERILVLLLLASSVDFTCAKRSDAAPIEAAEVYAPAYPDFMFMTNREAEVVVEVLVNPSGQVTEAKLLTPEDDEDKWFMTYCQDHEIFARRWRFLPTDVERRVQLHFIYKLLPEDTDLYELGTSYKAPSTVIIRAQKLPPRVWSDPIEKLPVKPKQPKSQHD